MRYRSFAILIMLLFVFNSCDTLKQLAAFTQCKFKTAGLNSVYLAGVNLDKVKNYKDLNFTDAASVAANILQNKLPLNFVVNVAIQNPNGQLAAMDGMDYIVLVDDVELSTGGITKRIEIQPNGGTATLPINIGTDLIKLFSKNDMQKLKDFAFGLRDANGQTSSRVTVKIKPSISVNGQRISYPNYITLSHNFAS